MSRLLLPISIALALLYAFPTEAQVIFPNRGGTGTTTAPAYGQVLVGNAQGTYTPTATSALGVTHDPVSLSGALDYLTIVGQNIVRGFIDLATDITGLLDVANGGTGTSSPSRFLFGTGSSIVSTSTISQNYIDAAIARVSALASYLPLSSWYATTTDALTEGTTNRYFTDSRADARARAVINASTSIPQEPGQAFGDLLRWSGSRWLGVATSTLGIFWSDVRNIPAGFADGVDDAFSTTSADYWDGTKSRWATSSSDYWLTTKSTSNLTEGSNLYYTLARFASALAGTTTNALSEGSTNKYYTDARVGSYISGSSTIPHTGGSAWGDLLRWTGSAWSAIATSTLGIAWGDLRGVPAGFADGTDDVGSAPTWGSITGTLSNQTDLQTALNAKVNNSTTTLPLLSTLPGLVSFGSSTATTTALGNLTAIGYVQLGTTTTAMLNGVIVVDGVNYPQTPAGAQNAINVCAAFPTTCSGVFFPNVAWPVFTSPLALKSGVDIRGASTTLVSSMTELGSHRGIFTITNQQDITIDGFNFIVTGSSTAITSYGHDSLTIQNNSFTGSSTGSGAAGVIALEGNSASADFNNTTIQGNRFYAMPTSQRVIYLYSRSGNVITNTRVFNNHFEGTRGPAVYLDDYDTITGTIVTNNTFTNLTSGSASTAPGVALFAGLAGLNNLIHDVTFSNNQYHNSVTTAGQQQGLVYIYSASGIVIDNNIAVGAWTPAVRVIGPAIAPGRTTTPVNGMTITNNHIEGFDAAWDPDSMRNVEVANNVVRNSGHGFDVGYGTQEYVKIHDNTTYNSTHYLYHSQLLFGASNPRKVSVTDNTYIDETSPATTTRAMFFTGHYDFSDVTVERNRFFFPNGTPTLTAKEFGNEKLPVVFRENEIETSAGITRNGPWLSNGNILFLGATTTGTGTTTNGLTMGDLAFYWDNAAKRLGVGTNSPAGVLSVTATSSATDAIRVIAQQDGYWLDGYVGSTQYFGLRQRSGYIEMQSFASTPLALNPQGNNVSVGVSTGSSKLTISGNTSIGSGYTGVAAPTNGLIVEGKVGIGTSSPYAALSVVGSTGVVAEKYNATGTATSSFAWDINLASGHCIQYNGSCISLTGGTSGATTTWRSIVQAWIYPGETTCQADEEYKDGRQIHTLKPEYIALNNNGTHAIDTVAVSGCNGYSVNNAQDVASSSAEQFFTISGNATGFAALMGSASLQASLIATSTAYATSTGFTGVEIDIEGYGSWSAADTLTYYTFLTNFANTLHANGKKLMVDLPPIWNSAANTDSGTGDEWDSANSTGYYNLTYQAMNATPVDYFVIMAYDYHFDYGGGASIQPLKWVGDIVAFAKKKIPDTNRIVIGMPAYGYQATTAGYDITNQTYGLMTLETGFGTAVRDGASGEMKWTNGGQSYVYNDSVSLDIKRTYIESLGIQRVSMWHLGDNQWFTSPSLGGKIELGNLPQQTIVATSSQQAVGVGTSTANAITYLGNALRVFIDNVERFVITASGNVGIGTSTPVTKLHVNGSAWIGTDTGGLPASAGKGIRIFVDDTYPVASLFGYDYATGASIDMVLQSPGGKVGVGTSTPATTLDVNGYGRAYQNATSTACGASMKGAFFYNNANSHFWGCNGSTWKRLD